MKLKMPIFDTNKLVITSLAVSVMILMCILFYLVAPHLRLTRHISNPAAVSTKIISTTSVDVAIIWDLDLAMNRQTPMGFAVRDSSDNKSLQMFVDIAKDVTLTSAMGAYELHAVLSAEPMCGTAPTISAKISTIAKQFFADNPNSYFCIIPIQDVSGAVSGQVSVIWRNRPSDDGLTGAIAQTRSLVKAS
jgi:hypothetical protein